nr:hypothetical protein [uncultured Cohaesibacter sp.]
MFKFNSFPVIGIGFSFLVPLVVLLGLSGCYQSVGGHCIYEEQIGTVKIVSKGSGRSVGVFTPADQSSFTNSQWWGQNLDLPKETQVSDGREYPALLSAIQTGSCVPVTLIALTDERRPLALPLSLDKDGRETEETSKRIDQILAVAQKLHPHWTRMKLLIHIKEADISKHDASGGVGSYFTSRLKALFEKAGLSPTIIEPSREEASSSPFSPKDIEAQRVFVSFKLGL